MLLAHANLRLLIAVALAAVLWLATLAVTAS